MTKQEKLERLFKFVNDKAGKFEQRSDAWHQMREKSFGGSEMAHLMGLCENEYINEKKFLEKKAGKLLGDNEKPLSISERVIMDWGTFFEPVHRNVMEEMFNAEIHETSLVEGTMEMRGCHESPDGIAVISREDYLKYVRIQDDWSDKEVFNNEYLTVLFEEKAPARRKPDGEVPSHYIGQVKLGLEIFGPICDIACYTEAVFLVCNVNEMFNKEYNKCIIKKKSDPQGHPTPLYVGLIEFDNEWFKDNIQRELPNQIYDPRLSSMKDLGDISSLLDDHAICVLTEHVKNGTIKAKYHEFKYDTEKSSSQFMLEIMKKAEFMRTYMCWKLVDLHFTSIEKSKGFSAVTSMYVNLGQKALERCDDCKDINDNFFDPVRKFGGFIENIKLPLTPANDEDKWYRDHKAQIIEFFEHNFEDTIDGVMVLINAIMLYGDDNDSEKAKEYIKRIGECCADDNEKEQRYNELLNMIEIKWPELCV